MSTPFLQWLRANDAWIHDALDWPVHDSTTGSRGCGVCEDVPPETRVLSVPRKLMWFHDRALSGLGPLVESDETMFEDNEQLAMATFLLQEVFSARGVSRLMSIETEMSGDYEDVEDLPEEEISPWEPYLRMLPPMSHFSGLPFLWSEEELCLLGDRSWAAACRSRREQLWNEFTRVQALLVPWSSPEPPSNGLHARRLGRLAKHWTWQSFLWAQCVYRTRCFLDGLSMGGFFTLEGMDSHMGFVMVPFVDMLNHSAAHENTMVDWDADDGEDDLTGDAAIGPDALARSGWDASAWGPARASGQGEEEDVAGGPAAAGAGAEGDKDRSPACPWGIGVPPGSPSGMCHVMVGENLIPAGQEVCISYGSERAMFDLVETYGFFDSSVDVDHETMLVPLPSSSVRRGASREDAVLRAIRDVGYTAANLSSMLDDQGAAGWLSFGMGDRTVPSFLESLHAVRVLCFSEGMADGSGDNEAALVEFSQPEKEVKVLDFLRGLIDRSLAEVNAAPTGEGVSSLACSIAAEYRGRRKRVLETHQQLHTSLVSTVGHFAGRDPVPRDTFTPLKELPFANHDLLVSYLQVWARFAPGR